MSRVVCGKVVLITGGSSGIGEATARRLAACGARVLLVARSEDQLDRVANAIRAGGGQASVYVADLVDLEQVDRLTGRVLAEHGHVDVLVNNAGKSIRRSIDQSYGRFHDFQRMMNLNYFGSVKLTLGILSAMRERRSGLIVNVSTFSVRMPPWPRWGGYQASKSAFDVWLRSAAAEARSDNVEVATVYMGVVETAMSSGTPSLHHLPAIGVGDASGLICDVVAGRRRNFAPWWVPIVQGATGVFPSLGECVASGVYSRTKGRGAGPLRRLGLRRTMPRTDK